MNQKNSKKGFTIIEVLIVLAIAGLIMLVVFLAVPSLQRNSRNQARRADAGLIAASIGECLSNNNGRQANCQAVITPAAGGAPAVTNGISWSANDMSQLTTQPQYAADVADLNGFAAANSSTSKAEWLFAARCDGATAVADAANQRSFALTYKTEGSGGSQPACIQS